MTTAFVTGSESGIGAACAAALAKEGHRLVCGYRTDVVAAQASAAACRALGVEAMTLACDIADPVSVDAAFAAMCGDGSVPDLLVHAAGIGGPAGETALNHPDAWNEVLAVNLTGAFLVSRAFIGAFRAERHSAGAAVFLSSIHAARGGAGGAAYSAAKAGLERLAESLAVEWAGDGVRVNAVRPGRIATAMNAASRASEVQQAQAEAMIPLGRAGDAQEVADLIAFLCSPRAAYITGTTITIDGGLSLMAGKGA